MVAELELNSVTSTAGHVRRGRTIPKPNPLRMNLIHIPQPNVWRYEMNHKLLVSSPKIRSNEFKTRSVNQVLELSEDFRELKSSLSMVALAKNH